jgi:undecaprenyl diphosphate synthase
MCINYGGRAVIADAAARLAADAAAGRIKPERITEASLAKYLYVPEMPDVDVVLRSSGEQRLSNFLIWQSAYAEFYFCDALWPDFGPDAFDEALLEFANRHRRYGR